MEDNNIKENQNLETIEPDDINIGSWKILGDRSQVWLTKFLNKVIDTKKTSYENTGEWRIGSLVPVYENKGGDMESSINED